MSAVLLSLCILIGVAIGLCSAFFVVGRRNPLTLLIIFFTFLIIIWGIGMVGAMNVADDVHRVLWFKLSLITTFLVPPTALLISWRIMARKALSRLRASILFIPGLLFLLLTWIVPQDGLVTKDLVGGYLVYQYSSSLSNILNIIITITHIPVVIFIMLKVALDSRNTRSRRIARTLIWASVIGIASTLAMRLPGLEGITPLRYVPSLFSYLVACSLVVFRYRGASDAPSFAADRLWDRVNEMLILVDEEGYVVSCNGKAASRFKLEEKSGLRLCDLFPCEGEIAAFMAADKHPTPSMQNRRLVRLEGEHDSIAYVSLERINDLWGDSLGFMAILQTSLPWSWMHAHYGITNKEWAVLSLLATGKEYREIADTLGVSPFTIKNHAHRIYEKTGLSNRHELLSLVFPF